MEIHTLYPEDLEQFLSEHTETDYQIVDVRQPQEYETGHIPGAKLLPLSELEGRLDELAEDRNLIFYCRSGKRSSMGAALARDSGLVNGSIANLVGGISGWQGKVLDEFPQFEALQGMDDPEKALEQAMNMEKGTSVLYESMVEQSAGLAIESTLAKLAKMEAAHARAIYRFLSKTKDMEPFEAFFANLSGDLVEGGWNLEAALERLRQQNGNTCLFLTEMALELEYRAYDLYRTLADAASDPEQQQALFFLSEQEKAHVRLLTRGLPGCF
jgi:rhodanese-related sulfurtransferase